MYKDNPNPFYVRGKRKTVRINEKHLPDVAALIILHLHRCEKAAKTQARMMSVIEDGTLVTSPKYYQHAAGYLRHLITCLMAGHPEEDIAAARTIWEEAQARELAEPPADQGS